MEETVGIGKESSCLGEHLSVCCPSSPFITLWTIGGYAQIVGAHAPDGIRDKLIDEFIARSDMAYLQFWRNGTDGY